MGVEADTAYESLATTEYCYISQGAPTTAYPGTSSASNRKVEAESFTDSSVDTAEEINTTETVWTTDNADVTDDFDVDDALVLKPSGGSLQTEVHRYVSGDGVLATVERRYDGTTDDGDIPTNADIYKSAKDMEVTLCTFTVKTPAQFGITEGAVLKDIVFNMSSIPGSGTMYIGFLKSDFSAQLATWNTSDGTTAWLPRYRGGSEGTEIIHKAYVTTTSATASLKTFVHSFGLTWGSKVTLAIWHNPTVIADSSSATTLGALQYKVTYEDPVPVAPVIAITANDDGLTWWDQRTGDVQSGTIKVISGLEEDDIAKMYLTTNTSVGTGLDAYNDNSGPHLTTEEVGRREFSTLEMSDTGLAATSTSYYRMFVEDANNQTTNAVASNIASAVRPALLTATVHDSTGAEANTFGVGDLVELRVASNTSGNHGSGPARGKIKKVWVNWESSPPVQTAAIGSAAVYLNAAMNDSQTTITVNTDSALDAYIYATGTNEVYLLLETYYDDRALGLAPLEAIKITSQASTYVYNCTRAQLGTTASTHEPASAYSYLYVYSIADRAQESLHIVNTESIDSYIGYELPSPSSSTVGSIRITHRYDSDSYLLGRGTGAGSTLKLHKSIKIVLEDEFGWRSGVSPHAAYHGTRSVNKIQVTAAVPTARINASRGESAVASTAGDRETAVVLSGANSQTIGTGRAIKEYKWSCTQDDAADIITSGVLDINNEPLEAASRKLYARCNRAAYNGAIITIIGLASFDANGTSIADDAAGFDDGYYKYTRATVSPGTAKYLMPTTADIWGANAVSATDGAVYFKQVDFVYVSTKSGVTASNTEIYQIFSSEANGDPPAAHDKSRCVVPRLCIDTDQNIWGGLAKISASGGSPAGYGNGIKCDVTEQRFESVTGDGGGIEDFIDDGFAPGDYVIVKGGFTDANQGVYRIDKVEKEHATKKYVYVDTTFKKIDSTETAALTSKKEFYVANSAISVASESDATQVFSLIVADMTDAVSPATTVSIPFRTQSTLDLDAAHNAGNIAIQSVKINRAGTLNATMPIGMRRYPVGTVHTKYGMPTLSMSVRVMDDTGFAYLTQLIDNRYNSAEYAYNKIASSETAYVTYKLKLQSWSVDRKPEQTSHEIYSLTFVISGESV